MRNLQTTEEMVKQHLAASKRVMDRIMNSENPKQSAIDFLISAGIYDETGELAEPYRGETCAE